MHLRSIAATLTTLLALPALAADFVGSESCRTCHVEAFEQWKDSPHARAHQTLTPAQQKDQRCIQCHAPDEAKGGDPGVSCETCHGAGEYYWPDHVMRDSELARASGLQMPDAKACLLCHDAASPALAPFDPAKKMAEIDHWSKTRAARGKKSEKGACNFRREKARQAAAAGAVPFDRFLARALASNTGKQNARSAVVHAQAARSPDGQR